MDANGSPSRRPVCVSAKTKTRSINVNVPKKLEQYFLETKIGAPATLALCGVAGGHLLLDRITNTIPTLAQDRLQDFVALLGLTNATPVLAALVIGLSLLRHHQQQRSWRFPAWFMMAMGVEAALWTVPLFGLGVLILLLSQLVFLIDSFLLFLSLHLIILFKFCFTFVCCFFHLFLLQLIILLLL